MKLPVLQGIIRRRMLVNYRVDPAVLQRQLPPPFRPKLHAGQAIAGICLIRLEQIRPRHLPAAVGVSSENAAHRIAVEWDDPTGPREGVFIPRRDTSALLSHLAGGRVFPGETHLADFQVEDSAERLSLAMRSRDGQVEIRFRARRVEHWPEGSLFPTLAEASRYFEPGSLGYSATAAEDRLEGIALATKTWEVQPLAAEEVHSTYFADPERFPPGTVEFDCALLMRDIEHEWQAQDDLYV